MQELIKSSVISAQDVMQLHRATGLGILQAKQLLEDASPLFYSRLMLATQRMSEERGILHDPIQDDPQIKPLFEQAMQETNELLGGRARRMGFCHLYWQTLKQFLKEKHNIEWFTPAEMNAGVIFD